jgi:hypothetical protein
VQRIFWAAESQDAHIIASLLHGHGIAAWAFDTGIVRVDWRLTLAFGGCRVLAADSDAERARHLVADYRSGALALADADGDYPHCPACDHGVGEDDPVPRRIAFGVLIASSIVFTGIFLLPTQIRTSVLSFLFAACLAGTALLLCPGMIGYAIKSRFRCSACGHTWRATPRQTFREMVRAVEDDQARASSSSSSTPP